MSSFLDELIAYVDTQIAGVVFTLEAGRNTFLNEQPATPDTCVAIGRAHV